MKEANFTCSHCAVQLDTRFAPTAERKDVDPDKITCADHGDSVSGGMVVPKEK